MTEEQTREQNMNGSDEGEQNTAMNENQFRATTRSNFEEQREEFNRAKTQFRNGAMNENQFQTHVANYLNKSVDKIDSLMSKVRNRVQDQDFDQFLNQTRLRLQNCTNKSELIDIAKQIRNEWKDYRIMAKQRINENASEKLNGIILNANGLARKLNATIQRMDQQGIDVSNLTAKLNQFQEKVMLAYQHRERAREMMGNFSDDANREQVMNEVHVQLRESQQALRDAHQLLKEILAEVKQKLRANAQNPLNSTENESEE
jgi:uncharacterized protein YaaW (UPF0174 family)